MIYIIDNNQLYEDREIIIVETEVDYALVKRLIDLQGYNILAAGVNLTWLDRDFRPKSIKTLLGRNIPDVLKRKVIELDKGEQNAS